MSPRPSRGRFKLHRHRCAALVACLLALAASALVLYLSGRDSARCWPAGGGAGRTCAMHGYGWQLPGSHTLYASVWSSETRWGNELSRYWQGRGMARLGGLSFKAVGDFHHAWLRYLPLRVSRRTAPQSCAAFDEACGACPDWKYSHKCLGGWTTLGEEVVLDTRAALQQYARVHHRRALGPDAAPATLRSAPELTVPPAWPLLRRRLPTFRPQDVVIHNRCSKDVWFWHGEYGPAAFSLYHTLPPDTDGARSVWDRSTPLQPGLTHSRSATHSLRPPRAATITIVGVGRQERGPRAHAVYTGEGLFPPCAAKLAALQATLSAWYPRARIVLGEGWDTFEDFVQMVYAPTLFKDASSFGLWAGMANNGSVVTARLAAGQSGGVDSFPIANWVWSNATVLYPAVAQSLGLNVSDTQQVITWLSEH